ncbi:MAG: GAF domain-containing sensor histidine kinase [Chloroflexi bacterium]|nr:GAF domain-containing sensor histidine kinase [Chloroflexota bacterium]
MSSVLITLKEIASDVIRAAAAETVAEVLDRIAVASRKLVKARYAALGIPDGAGNLAFFKFTGMTDDEVRAVGDLPQGRGLLGALMTEHQPIRLDHIRDDPRSIGFPPNHPPMDSFLGVPIIVGQQLYGMLYLCDREDGEPFHEEDQWLIETLAGYAALAIAGAQLGEQRNRLTLFEERERISMELHDGVIQSLYAIGMQIDLMRADRTLHEAELDGVIQNLNTVIDDIRSYIQNLKSRAFAQQTIRACMEDIVNHMHLPGDMHIEIDAPDGPAPLTPTTYEAVRQMTNEAISNAIRHAEAQHIRIEARHDTRLFQILISDDGRGFDPNAPNHQNGLGLRNIKERARLHGGHIHIKTAPGQGTHITLSLPVNH